MRLSTLFLIAAAGAQLACKPAQAPIRIGVLHSLTGTMAASERPVADAVLLAVEEVNQAGGVLGRRLEAVVADGASDPEIFRREAERLVAQERVAAIFGCWTSASRKAVKEVVEGKDSLLFYPVQYEGLELSPNIVYLGAAPNQQIIPAVTWAFSHLGKRFFFVGSDYVFPRTAHAIAKDVLRLVGGQVVGEAYAPMGGKDFAAIVEAIRKAKPDVILNTVNGDGNSYFFEALHQAGFHPGTPVISLSLDENVADAMRRHIQARHPGDAPHFLTEHLAGTYACWSYFESVDVPGAAGLLGRFRRKYGQDRRVTDPMAAAYSGLLLWAQAVEENGDFEHPRELMSHLALLSRPGPGGVISVDGRSQHLSKTVRIGRLDQTGEFAVVWTSPLPVSPAPYPLFRRKAYWDGFLAALQRGWGGRWTAPGAAP